MKSVSEIDRVLTEIENAAMRNVEWHGEIWTDVTWTIALERHPYGAIRMWIAKEYKGKDREYALCYVKNTGCEVRVECDIKLAKHVERKAISIYKHIIKRGLM